MAVHFNGNGNHSTSTSSPLGSSATTCTIAGWFTVDDLLNQYGIAVCVRDTAGTANAFELGAEFGVPEARVDGAGVFARAVSSQTMTAGTYHHLCARYAGVSDRSIFVDGGNEVNETTTVGTTSGLDVAILGDGQFDSVQNWDGNQAEIAIWDVDLTDAEIAMLAIGVRPIFIRPGNLVFYVPCLNGDTTRDIVGGDTLSVTGTATAADHPRIIYNVPQQIITPETAAPSVGGPRGPLGHPILGPFGGPIG